MKEEGRPSRTPFMMLSRRRQDARTVTWVEGSARMKRLNVRKAKPLLSAVSAALFVGSMLGALMQPGCDSRDTPAEPQALRLLLRAPPQNVSFWASYPTAYEIKPFPELCLGHTFVFLGLKVQACLYNAPSWLSRKTSKNYTYFAMTLLTAFGHVCDCSMNCG